uniref:Piwi domain-containing protein n=2 Tax=Parascaris univalens TaxID=6257 RepID=A0A915ADT8_PARUN
MSNSLETEGVLHSVFDLHSRLCKVTAGSRLAERRMTRIVPADTRGLSKRSVDVCMMEEDPPVVKENLLLPAKPIGGSRLKQAGSIAISMNGYELDLSRVPDKVFKHELKLIAVKKDKEKDLTHGPKNDIAVTLRRRVLWSIYTTILKSNQDFFGSDTKVFFYDCGINFYSLNKLLDSSEGEKEFHLKPEQLSSNSREFLGPKVVEVVGKLLACEVVYLRSTAAINESVAERERSLQHFLEVALNQKMFHDQEHLIFGNKAYNRPSSHDRPLSGGKVLQSGFEKNVRFVGNSSESAVVVAQIDAKKSAFFKEQNLVMLVATLCHNRLELIKSDAKTRQRVARQLKDLVVRTNHLPKAQRNFCIFGMTKESADGVIIMVENQELSVAQYFYHKYNIGLRHSDLPCVIERRVSAASKGAVNSYFPMECLDVIKGQRVEIKKQTPDLVEELINGCRLLPGKLMEENERQRCGGHITSENPYLYKLGLRVSETPRGADAKVLFPPAIVYGEGGRIEPNAGGELDWRLNVPRGMTQRQFYRPANPPRRWVVFIFEDAVDRASLDRFLYVYMERAQSHGIKISRPSRVENFERVDMDFLLERMKVMRKNGVEYVLFITKERRDPVHDIMKFSETVAMVVTQHVHSRTLLKAISNRGAEMTLDNLLMKMNLKLGGISHGLASSTLFLRSNQLAANIMERTWLRASRMFVGIDMSHSSSQSLYERQAGIPPSEPTVVGMAFTCGGPFAMRGDYWMQEPRVATVQCLKNHVVNALNFFREESSIKDFPEHVVVFRGGVSEGEYAKVMSEEAGAFRDAFKHVTEDNDTKIRLSIICVQVNSNYRLFRENLPAMGNAAQQNVPSGTCVDTAVVHPTQTEFILVAHKSIMGTARPIRCTVLVDDKPRMSLDEVEGVTNALCYAHGIVTSPISLPAHLCAARDLAKRGRNNWKAANSADDDVSMLSGDGERGKFANDGTPEFFPNLSAELAPKLKYKFWA